MALSLRLQRPDEQPQIRLAQPAPAQTISIKQSRPAPAQTISTRQIQPAQSAQQTTMPQQAQLRMPTINPQMPQAQQIRLPRMSQPQAKQPELNLLQQFGQFATNVNNATFGNALNAVKAVPEFVMAGEDGKNFGDNVSDMLVGNTTKLINTANEGVVQPLVGLAQGKSAQEVQARMDKNLYSDRGGLNNNGTFFPTKEAYNQTFKDPGSFARGFTGAGIGVATEVAPLMRGASLLAKPGLSTAQKVVRGGAEGGLWNAPATVAQQMVEQRDFDAKELAGNVAAGVVLGGAIPSLAPGVKAGKKMIDNAGEAPHIRTLEHPAVQDVKAHADLLFQKKQSLIDGGLSPTSPAVKQLDNAIRSTGKLYNDTYKTVYEAQTQGGFAQIPGKAQPEVPKKLTEEQYLVQNGASFMKGAEPALDHNKIPTKRGQQEVVNKSMQEMSDNNARRIVLREEYKSKVASGEIVAPTREEILIDKANGIPELEATQAARRLLDKKGIDWKVKAPKQDLIIKNGGGKAMSMEPRLDEIKKQLDNMSNSPEFQDFYKGGKVSGRSWNEYQRLSKEYRDALDSSKSSKSSSNSSKPTLQDALEGKSTKIKASTVASTIDQTVSPTPSVPERQLTRKRSNQVLPAQEMSQTVSETSMVGRMPETQALTDRTYTTDSTPLTDTKQYVKDMTRAQNDARKGDFNLREKGADFKAKFVDDLAPIEDRLNKAIKQGAQVDPKDHIRYQLDRSRRAEGITQAYINDKGLARIIQDVPNTNEFDQYLIAKHAKELDEGVKTGRNAQADQQLIDELAHKYEAYAKEVYKYNQGLLDQAVDYGLISKELAQSLKKQYPEYVPLNRVFKDDELSGVFGSKADASIGKQSAVQKIKGSDRAISSPLNSIIDKTRVVVEQGERNKAAQILASYEKFEGNPFNLREIPTSETIGNRSTISFLENGKKRTFETDPDIAEAAKHMTREQIGLWGRIAAVPARVLRAGATGVNVGFAGANVVKDVIGAAINSQHGMRVADPRSVGKALAAALNHNGKYYQELMREGVAGTSFDMYRNPNKMNVGEVRSQKNLGTRSIYNLTHPSQWYRTLENSIGRSEDFGRALQYYSNKDGYLAKGMNSSDAKLLAGDQARYNSTNFFRSGSYGKGINLAVPYWNAGVQGARIQVRRIKERPVQTVAKMGLAVAAPSAMIAVNNYADEKKRAVINEIADYEKQSNIVIVGDNARFNEKTNKWEDVYKIPVPPQHIGIHNAIQKAVESSYNGTPYDIVKVLGGIAENYTTVNPTDLRANANRLTPQGLKLIAEPLTNTNMYTGNSIVPFYQKDLPANEQVSKYSSLTAKTIGNMTNTSPRMIDNAIRTAAGGAGQNAVNIIDNGLVAAGMGKKEEVRGKSITSSITDRFLGANQKQDDKKSAQTLSDEKAAKKKADTGWMDEYKAAKASFDKDSGSWNPVEREKKAKELASLEVRKNFSKEATSLYDMAEKDIYGFLDKQEDKKAQHYLNQIVSYGDKMVEAGLWKTNKLRDKYGNVQYGRGYGESSGKTASRASGSSRARRAGTGRKTAARGGTRSARGKFDYKLHGFAKSPSTTSSDLYALLKKAKMKRNTA